MNLKINHDDLYVEVFREFGYCTYVEWAKRQLEWWFGWDIHALLGPMREIAWMLRWRQDNLIHYFRMSMYDGPVVRDNSNESVIYYKAYGFRTAKHHIRNLYHCMAKLPSPQPCIHPRDEASL